MSEGRVWAGFFSQRTGASGAVSFERVNEPSGYMKCEKFLVELSDYCFSRMAVTEEVIIAVTL